jgi:hypothetical protein
MNAIWAVGQGGTAVFYNGSYWSNVSTGTTYGLSCVHGTSPSNVFAVTALGEVYKFDGNSWSPFTTVPANNGACSWVAGPDDLFVSVYSHPSNTLYRVTPPNPNDPLQTLGGGVSGSWRMSGTSASDVWAAGNKTMHYDGVTVTDMGYATDVYAFDPDTAYLAQGATYFKRWTSQSGMVQLNTGVNTQFHAVTGTDVDRVFLTGGSQTQNQGAMVFYDGLGTVPVPLPANIDFLYHAWASPTGEVVAVGRNGTIVLGN